MAKATWEPPIPTQHGRLDAAEKNALPDSAFAFPRLRKEPMTDASHVINAMARFDQIEGVTDSDRDVAFANIQKAARYFGIKMKETDWHQLGSGRAND
ncbi:MAG TPA: DUF6582 domain-containing protein [Methanoregulaceae archaeon]|nr:DUF6582 domain-containing protein [Methanoregulaceae archaeon]